MNFLLFKDNVTVCFSVYVNHILRQVQDIMFQFGVDCVVTGGIEGTHSAYSAHYRNMALDFRTHHIPQAKRGLIFDTLCKAFDCDHNGKGTTYDVLWESQGTPHEHYHVEQNAVVEKPHVK
jgi:hypothetical protein